MSPIHPKSFTERDFPKAIRGYSIPEVDEYLDRVLENYAALYRENIELEKRLSEMQAKLDTASIDEANVRRTLQNAKKASESIIEEAYVKADEILASIKADCDATLRTFRDKIEKEKKNLREIKESVAAFKDELFEKYRVHIELVEQLAPSYDYEEEISADAYVDEVIAGLKREVAAQYGLSIEDLKAPESVLIARNVQATLFDNDDARQKRSGVPSMTSLLEDEEVIPDADEDDSFPAI